MKALIQRVTHAQVDVANETVGKINKGLLVLLGVEQDDTTDVADRLLKKILSYRVFNDDAGKMNLNIEQAGGALLVVSQFTLVADTRKGNRPGFSKGASPELGKQLYEHFVTKAAPQIETQTGQFGADMQVSLTNDGPVTFMLEIQQG